jgi:hypothetical protein
MWHSSRGLWPPAAALAMVLVLAAGLALAQTAAPDFKQVRLSDKHVQGFITAQKDLVAIQDELQKVGDKPDAKLQAKLDDIAKKNGFASFNEMDDVAANISMVMAGLDPQSGAYTDPVEAIKKEIEDIKKDAAIPEKDRKQMLEELAEALKSTPPLQFKENIEVVKRFQKEIEKALQ